MNPSQRAGWLIPIALAFGGGLACAAVLFLFGYRLYTQVEDLQRELLMFEDLQQVGRPLADRRGDSARTEIVRLPGVTLPPAAADLYFAREGELDPTYWVRFTLPPAQLATFTDATCLTLTPDTVPAFVYTHDEDLVSSLLWWTPERSAAFVGGTCSPRAGVRFRALVDQTVAARWTVYLEIVTGERAADRG